MEGLRLHMQVYPYCDRYGLATVAIKVQDLLNYTSIDPMVQRKLSPMQRRKIANYLQEKELSHIFFGPVTLSLRDVNQLSRDKGELVLKHGSKLSILDGQHRIMALGFVNEQLLKEVRKQEKKRAQLTMHLRRFPHDEEAREELELTEGMIAELEARRLALMETTLSAQIYIGLGEEEERQLFGDINSKVLIINKELGQFYDHTDPLNNVVKEVAEHNTMLKAAGVERRNNLTAFNKNFTSITYLYATASLLFCKQLQPTYTLEKNLRKDPTFYVEILHQYFDRLLPLLPEQPGLSQYISSSRLMQESIALYMHDHLYQDGEYNEDWGEAFRIFAHFDWTHENKHLAALFGRLENGKINLSHEKSLRKHRMIVDLLHRMSRGGEGSVANL